MTTLEYDGSFAGLLTAIFEAYERALASVRIAKQGSVQTDIFSQTIAVLTDEAKAKRVWAGLEKKLSPEGLERIFSCYLSELQEAEGWILELVRYVFTNTQNVEEDFGNAAVLWLAQTARKVWREKHRMEAFVRFQKLQDGLFYAAVEPDYNVLPLISRHFKSRYADQDWLIYDLKRRYGIHYEKKAGTVREVQLEWTENLDPKAVSTEILDEREILFQTLWKDYFKHTGIPARQNLKLHLRHVPLRYWKHLTEKRVG